MNLKTHCRYVFTGTNISCHDCKNCWNKHSEQLKKPDHYSLSLVWSALDGALCRLWWSLWQKKHHLSVSAYELISRCKTWVSTGPVSLENMGTDTIPLVNNRYTVKMVFTFGPNKSQSKMATFHILPLPELHCIPLGQTRQITHSGHKKTLQVAQWLMLWPRNNATQVWSPLSAYEMVIWPPD